MSEPEAVEELRRCEGTHFDGDVLAAFFRCLERFSPAQI